MEGPAQSPSTPAPTCPPPTCSPAPFSQTCFPSRGRPCPACPLLIPLSSCKHHVSCPHSHPLPAPTALPCTGWRRAHSEDTDAAGLGSVQQQSQGLRSHSQTKDPYRLHAPAAGHHRHCLPRCPAPHSLPEGPGCCSHLPPLLRGSLEHWGYNKAPNWGDACRGRRDICPVPLRGESLVASLGKAGTGTLLGRRQWRSNVAVEIYPIYNWPSSVSAVPMAGHTAPSTDWLG